MGCSWDMPLQVFDVNTLGVIRCLEAIRKFKARVSVLQRRKLRRAWETLITAPKTLITPSSQEALTAHQKRPQDI